MTAHNDPLFTELERQRVQRGWSARRLSLAAGLNQSAYATALRHGACTLYVARALCAVFGLDVIASPKAIPTRTVRPLAPCGTPSAARRHWARGEKPCGPCLAATRAYDTARKRDLRARRAGDATQTPGRSTAA